LQKIFSGYFHESEQSVKTGKYQDNGKIHLMGYAYAHNLIIDHFRRIRQMNTISNDEYELTCLTPGIRRIQLLEDDMIKRQIQKDVRKG